MYMRIEWGRIKDKKKNKEREIFVNFWNLATNYQLMINNGDSQTHHHFHVKLFLEETIANRMRRDHFTRINLEKTYNEN